ncbi:MAG: ABC transporter ATP-binding protein/permease [Gemmataceae bacterium]|nr:ABC transporter ATP-binding protein/permease [Gemmataceae bacterium]
MNTSSVPSGFVSELRLIVKRGRQVWRLIPRRHKVSLGFAALVMALTSACNTSLPVLLGKLVDGIKQGTEHGESAATLYRLAATLLGMIAAAYLVREALNVLRRYLVENTCTRINRDMSLCLVGHLMKADLTVLARDKVGTLHGKIFRSVDGLVRFLRVSFLDFFPALATGLFAIGTALFIQPWLGLAMLGVIPISVLLTVRQLISQKGVRLKLLRSAEAIDGAVVEQFGGIEYIRAADTCRSEMKRLGQAAEKRRAKEIRHHFEMSLFGCAKALNEGLFHVLVLALAIYLAVQGEVSFGDVLTFSILFLNVMAPLSEVHRVLDEGHESSLRVGDLIEMLSRPKDRAFDTVTTSTPRLAPAKPLVEVADLQVEYLTPQATRRRALHGISLTIRHGETIGVAGRSGCGKSTWLKVLLRLTHPCGGQVRLGGVPLEAVSREDIARLIGYVGQQPFVFAGTIAENIAYGNEGATMDDIRRVARMAALHDEILSMPQEYYTAVTERGQNLSGGQRQRLAIARVLLKQPPLLILDEATSALDNISERDVQRSLGLTSADRTTILVAHRLSTLRDADRIFVFDGGRIAEVGAYDDLVTRGGVFAELVASAENGVTSSPSPETVPTQDQSAHAKAEHGPNLANAL